MTARSAPAAALPVRQSAPRRPIPSVYLTPVVLFLAGYLLTALLGASVGVQYFTAAVGFFAGIVAAVAYDRKLRARGGLSFTIVRLF